jgi:hypothetical protein
MSHMRKMWEREHDIAARERERKRFASGLHRQGMVTRRKYDEMRAEIETQAADARSDMFAAFLGDSDA